ncbi:MAG: hypothetical protein IT338_04310 [Thermomicrobiales bacterium]|nr:hypothetical protein [Thermomicrobiales bacterium]
MGWRHRRRSEGTAPESIEPSDDELVDLARGDPAAFALLYRRYAVAVYRYCDRALSGRAAAEEVMQSVFLHALAALPTYRGGSFRSWLFAIAHNAVVDARAARRRAATLDEAAELPDGRVSAEAELTVRRLTLPPGASIVGGPAPGLKLVGVEAGTLTIDWADSANRPVDGQSTNATPTSRVVLPRDYKAGSWADVNRAGTLATPRGAGPFATTLRNDGSEPVTLLALTVVSMVPDVTLVDP